MKLRKVKALIVISMIAIITVTGCGNTDSDSNNNDKVINAEQKDEFKPAEDIEYIESSETTSLDRIEGDSYFDSVYNRSDYTLDENESVDSTESQLLDIPEVPDTELVELATKVYNEQGYTSYKFMEYYDGDELNPEHTCVICYNNDQYWVFRLKDGKAYAEYDEYGVYTETYDDIITDTEEENEYAE